MIVMKFGGTSVADAERIRAAVAIVEGRLPRRPVVVVSALAGVTDLLARAVSEARTGSHEGLEPLLADLARRHRWAVSGSIDDARRRHDLGLAVDALFEELRQLLRSMRVLGEGTPRSSDALLAFGELLSSRIVTAALEDRGIAARLVDAREVMITDDRFGRAEPDLDAIAARAQSLIAEPARAGAVPVMGGFFGATTDGRTTTLGRGGGDTSASVLGAALSAEEIEIWTDVDGIMTADPRCVPGARRQPSVTFAEAAELAYYGAKVIHPPAIAPAVRSRIPVRVLNTLRPEGPGTVILQEAGRDRATSLASVASRGGVVALRVTSRTLRVDPGFLPRVLSAVDEERLVPDLVVSSEVAVALALPQASAGAALAARLATFADVASFSDRGIVCVVGQALERDAACRASVLRALSAWDPEIVAAGGSETSIAAVLREERLPDCVRALHHDFFEPAAA